MSGATGPLQRLTDEQVNARLAAYNPDGSLDQDVALLRDHCSDLIASEIVAQFGPERAARYAGLYANKVDASWVQGIAEYGREIYRERTAVPVYIAARTQTASRIAARLADEFRNDPALLTKCFGAFMRMSTFETDIILAQVALLEAIEAADVRGRESEQFERRVTDLVLASTEQSKALTERTRSTSTSARGMLGKTSEVAAAAEQSAVAMREAAQTAAGLIRAIEDARSEVEVAAGVATRAGDQAGQAVKVSQALSAHVEAIESILSLIRDIAGQTNLLALNATIEAARAGDSGRGFAVVASEVKALANQTAKATEEISSQVAAMQASTSEAVASIGGITETIAQMSEITVSISTAVEQQGGATREIAKNIQSVAAGSNEISAHIGGVTTAAAATGKAASEVLASARELDTQSGMLRSAVDEFLVKVRAA